MRIPAFNVARSFPELDKFSDAECARFTKQAVSRRRGSAVLYGIVAVGAAIAAMGIAILLLSFVVRAWGDSFGGSVVGDLIMLTISVGAPILSAALAGLTVRDWWLRRTILGMIRSTNCPSCGYSLLGLAVVQGTIACPECGLKLLLSETDLKEGDFLAKA